MLRSFQTKALPREGSALAVPQRRARLAPGGLHAGPSERSAQAGVGAGLSEVATDPKR